MWVTRKRKWIYYDPSPLPKRIRLHVKIKRNADRILLSTVDKKQKVCDSVYCLVHDEAYICGIYECSGVQRIEEYDKYYMPYIN
jgi:hypothetical protein